MRVHWRVREIWHNSKEAVCMGIAWALPRRLVEWAFIRVWAFGTVGQYSEQDATTLTAADALKRFSDGAK